MQGRSFNLFVLWVVLVSALWTGACTTTNAARPAPVLTTGSCAIALLTHQGDEAFDRDLRQRQGKIRQMYEQGLDVAPNVEALGWRFVEKARRSYDPGFYKMAEQCATCMESLAGLQPAESGKRKNAAALLLRGHVLHNLHRFDEAEPVARQLVAQRGLPLDFALWGDVLLEQGKLDAATVAYQKLLDLKPGLQAYVRAAQLRWLQGDTEGAIEMALQAVRASSPNEPEAGAWAATKLAFYDLHYGALPQAAEACEIALKLIPDYAPALLVKGRVLLAQQRAAAAIPFLQQATKLNPLPEYRWALADALRVEKRDAEAQAVEALLQATGAGEDPRTFALYLATRNADTARALKLAEDEVKTRKDIHSHDAVAWALFRAGQAAAAWQNMQKALSVGTQDTRLHFHAAVIAQAVRQQAEARKHFKKARQRSASLFPSERAQLLQLNL